LLADLSFFELRLSTLLPKKPASLLSDVAGDPFLHSGVALARPAVIRSLPRE
jgi:hypothetical protein